MKKHWKFRLLSILAAIALCAGLTPAALADDYSGITTYSELAARIESGVTGQITVSPAADFGWPASGTLTVPAGVGISISWLTSEFEIPNGIKVIFERNCQGFSCNTLRINGEIHTAYSSQDSLFNGCEKVIIGPAGTFSCENDTEGQPTLCGQRIAPGKTWEVQEGGTLNARIRLGGALTGSGAVSGRVSVQGGFSGTSETEAVLSGSLTITGSVNVGNPSSYGSEWEDVLTIPAGSNIRIKDGGIFWCNGRGTLKLEGNMDISGENSRVIFLEDSAVLGMTAGSEIAVHAPGRLGHDYTGYPASPHVTGSGTIKLYKDESGNQPSLFHMQPDILDAKPTAYDQCVEQGITIVRTWICDHAWSAWATTKEPTCGEAGVQSRTCSKCGSTETKAIDATGEHSWNTSTWEKDAAQHWRPCAACGEKKDAAAHSYGDWTVTQDAAGTTPGSRYRDCTVCAYRETQVIPIPAPSAVLLPSSSGGSTVQYLGETALPAGARAFAVRLDGGRMAEAAPGTVSGEDGLISFETRLTPGRKLFFLDPDAFIPLARPAVLE